ncbi:hypothetical protein BD626DRAFT_575206 [Schizophyllum amplum]|uniref:Uncharacterized protein n=1 Tax=Schizophyllum amplum TaxID=97359 RepID=A0A550BWC5_9AGAR|nr:hypothetical protein BD626DRAFT_575206 [Auriculariopsis ampla]
MSTDPPSENHASDNAAFNDYLAGVLECPNTEDRGLVVRHLALVKLDWTSTTYPVSSMDVIVRRIGDFRENTSRTPRAWGINSSAKPARASGS